MTATTHKESKLQLLTGCGADIALLDNGPLAGQTDSITKALELVGIKTVKDTLSCMEKGGIVCNTGNLGRIYKWNGFDPVKDIPNGIYLTGFFSNTPTQEIISDIFAFLDTHNLTPHIGAGILKLTVTIMQTYLFMKSCSSLLKGQITL